MTCGMEQTRTGACIAICKEMDGTPRIPWFGVGATLQTMADLYDTPNGYPPAPTEEDMGDGANFGEEGWLEFHPLRVLDGGITLRVAWPNWIQAKWRLADGGSHRERARAPAAALPPGRPRPGSS